MQILYGIVIVIALLFLVDKFSRARIERLRQQGIYPPAGQETEADVERLLTMGHKIEAIKAYRAIHGVGLKDAKEAVEALAARLKQSPRG
jgi:ribosomal protein L7/L12